MNDTFPRKMTAPMRTDTKQLPAYYCQTCYGEGWMSADCMPPGEKCIDCNGTGLERPRPL